MSSVEHTESGASPQCPDVVEIVSAEYKTGYILDLVFSDGWHQSIDFEPFLLRAKNPMTTKYRNLDLFRSFTIVYGALTWNDDEMCFPIADLYEGRL